VVAEVRLAIAKLERWRPWLPSYVVATRCISANFVPPAHSFQGNSSLNGSVFDPGTPFYEDIQLKNPQLQGSEYAALGYYRNNFNDIVSSFIVLFELMVVNQWHVIADGFVILTSKYARVYFVTYHMTSVVIFMK
jgi:hypothetical protein